MLSGARGAGWRFTWNMAGLALACVALEGALACSGNRPPSGGWTPPPPEPQCIEGQNHSCWHKPPDSRTWLYACYVPSAPGGVVNVVGGPAQCPTTPVPPEPTPEPPKPPDGGGPVGPTPPRDQYVFPDLLLRQGHPPALDRAGVPFKPFGCIQCCAEDIAFKTYWPQAGPAWMDYCGGYGANFFHFRGGPFTTSGPDAEPEWADVGGPYLADGSDNPAYWQKVRDHAFYAGARWKANVQYVLIDTWGCKVDQQRGMHYTGWPSSEVDACGRRPSPGQEHHIRKAVEELGCLGNVVWITGNESALIGGATLEWQNWVIGIVRDQEQKSLCSGTPVVHMIGIDDPQWVDAPADYVSTHARAPLSDAVAGAHTENNERNPEFSPEQEHAYYCEAQAKGLHWWFWNAGMTEAERSKTLELFRSGCGGAVGCFAPPAEPQESWEWHDRTYRTPQASIREAIDAAKATVGSQCGQTGPTPEDPQNAHAKQEHTLELVAAEVRARGFCATAPWGDALAVTREDGLIEEHHVVEFGQGCFTSDPAVNPKAYWRWLAGTPPQPGPTPPASSCTNPDPQPIDHWNLKEHTKGPNKTVLDSTPIVRDAAYCAAIGFTDGRRDCPIRMEGDPQRSACEATVVGTPRWTPPRDGNGNPVPCTGCQVDPANPYLYWVPRGVVGTVSVCTSTSPEVCGSLVTTP